MKEAYTTQELMEILKFQRNSSVFYYAKRENWQSQQRGGRGAGKEWLIAAMHEATQIKIALAESYKLEKPNLPAKVDTPATEGVTIPDWANEIGLRATVSS